MLQDDLLEHFNKNHTLNEMALYHLKSGGKQLRGRLAVAEGQHCCVNPTLAKTWGVACELLHNATLIHDDIQDNDPIRRGQPSLWKKYGIAQAINAGDYLIFKSFKLASSLKNWKLPLILAETADSLVKGQSDELETLTLDHNNSYWSSYVKMSELKTGTLFQLPALGIQALSLQKQDANQDLSFWLQLGTCYQIFDDIRDFLGLKQTGQKQKDFTEQRVNALIALLSCDSKNDNLVSDYINAAHLSKEHIKLIEQLNKKVIEDKIIEQLRQKSEIYITDFCKKSNPSTQKIILDFMKQATHKGAAQYVQPSL